MQPVCLALFWHQHQPYYPDDVRNENVMPWVRLHAVKDYYGMAVHLKEVPEFRCTINLVPSLLYQIQRYADGSLSDRHLDLSRAPADSLSKEDACFILDNFFMANRETMIRPHGRYYELYLKRGLGTDSAKKALRRFSERDLRDLQVWFNLTWIHPLAFEQDADLKAFRQKGQFWTEKEKQWLLDKQLEILRQVIPLHRELAESGQVELTTSPFFHPILPLLWDKRSARQAMPMCKLPKYLEPYPDDARWHLRRAVEYHTKLFGQPPVGMWPSEGSVSQDIVAPIAEVGIQWIATDEEILAQSTNGWVSRDEHGYIRHPEMLYQPWRVVSGQHELQIIFRDHALSDLIGFQYQRSDPVHAAHDLLGRVEAIGRAVEGQNRGRPALVPIILDGENCWEYYPDGGVQFLRTLYQEAVRRPTVQPVRVADFLHQFPATDRIGQLFAGSWISHNFAIWIGHDEDNTAWDLLHQTREFVKRAESSGQVPEERREQVWREIYIAEGSDWFWWYGDDHSSAQDSLFDELFRRHLQNVYLLLEQPVPPELNQPISRGGRRAIHTQPIAFLPVVVDGRAKYFEWVNAGRYVSGSERGTMTMVTRGLIREIRFGFDERRMFVRIDTARRAAEELSEIDELRVVFLEPPETVIRVSGFGSRELTAKLVRGSRTVSKAAVAAAVDEVVELSVSFSDLHRSPDQLVRFFVEAFSGKQSVDKAPREGVIEFAVPSPDFEMIMWQV